MSETKRAELIDAGALHDDGTRIPTCPVCGQDLPEGFDLGGATVETVEAEVAQ